MEIKFTITGGIPSKKNRHIIKKSRKSGHQYIGSDDTYRLWEAQNASELEWLIKSKGSMIGYSNLHIEYTFRQKFTQKGEASTKHWDLSNKIESINDMMVRAHMIDDDSQDIISSISARVENCEIVENEVEVVLSRNS